MASSQGKQLVATGFVIFRRFQSQIQFLMLHASYEENLWTPPKGHVDPGETEIEAAFRETKEEAGLSESQIKVVEGYENVLNYTVRGRPKRVVYWLAELQDPNTKIVLSDEHRDFCWADLTTAQQLTPFPDQKKLYETAHNFINGQS